jgi:hypothetical protein
MEADLKSGDQIEADIEADEVPSRAQVIADLWRQTHELQARIAKLESRLED